MVYSGYRIACRIHANGFEEITLGTQRLRTETAAVVATVMASVANAGQ